MKANIIILVTSQRIGFLTTIGKLLSKDYSITFIARDNHVKNIIESRVKNCNILIQNNFHETRRKDDVFSKSMFYENKYNITFSFLCSLTRDLGRGYLFNIANYPNIVRSKWNQSRKYSIILNQLEYYEYIINKYKPILLIGTVIEHMPWVITNKLGIPYFGFGIIKYADRYFWIDNLEYYSNLYKESIKHYLKIKT